MAESNKPEHLDMKTVQRVAATVRDTLGVQAVHLILLRSEAGGICYAQAIADDGTLEEVRGAICTGLEGALEALEKDAGNQGQLDT